LRLLLDEHYSPAVARELRKRGHDVVGVGERADLRGVGDEALFAWANGERRAIVTQDVADFVVIVREAALSGTEHHGVVFTSPRVFPLAARGIGRLVAALSALLNEARAEDALTNRVHWLRPADG
jgi:predicted nuclease of predicted toxin-antitoxin system